MQDRLDHLVAGPDQLRIAALPAGPHQQGHGAELLGVVELAVLGLGAGEGAADPRAAPVDGDQARPRDIRPGICFSLFWARPEHGDGAGEGLDDPAGLERRLAQRGVPGVALPAVEVLGVVEAVGPGRAGLVDPGPLARQGLLAQEAVALAVPL